MWLILFIPLVALAIGSLAYGAYRARKAHNWEDDRTGAASLTVGLVLAVVFGLLAWVTMPNSVSAEDESSDDSQAGSLSASKCEEEPKVAETADYGIDDPGTNVFAATGGNLIGNGPPLDSSSAGAAVTDLYERTEYNPKLTANLAYIMRLSGFTPKDETRDAMKVDVAFLDARVASLTNDHKLWSQTRRNICIRLGDVSMDADPYRDRDLTEITTRVAPVEAEGVRLPVTNVVLGRSTQPDGVRLLWINREVDTTGERPQKFPIAVDVQYAWPVVVGEIPESAERPKPPSPEQQQQDQQFQQQQEQQAEQRKQGGGKDKKSNTGNGGGTSQKNQANANEGGGGNATGGGQNSGTTGGKGGGSGSGCGDSGCGTGGGTGGAGGGGSTPPPTGTSPPPTSPPPTSPPPTQPPPTAPPTTKKPPTTTTSIPCPPWAC